MKTPAPRHQSDPSPPGSGAVFPNRPPDVRILVVERAAALWTVLEAERLALHRAHGVEDALARLAGGGIDLVLLGEPPDGDGDGGGGAAAVRRIRALPDEDMALVPIIAVVAQDRVEERAALIEAGADELLAAPPSRQALGAAIDRHRPAVTDAPTLTAEDWARLCACFARSCKAALSALNDPGTQRDALAALAHRLKGSGANFGQIGVSDAARALEDALTWPDGAGDDEHDRRLEAAMVGMRRALLAALSAMGEADR